MSPESLLGTAGVSALLLAFVLNLYGVLGSDRKAYHVLNIGGASLSCLASALLGFVPFVVLEFVWGVAAVAALLGIDPRRAGR